MKDLLLGSGFLTLSLFAAGSVGAETPTPLPAAVARSAEPLPAKPAAFLGMPVALPSRSPDPNVRPVIYEEPAATKPSTEPSRFLLPPTKPASENAAPRRETENPRTVLSSFASERPASGPLRVASSQVVAPAPVAPALSPFPDVAPFDFGVEERAPASRLTLSAEYLRWTFKADQAPPLVTTSPPGSNAILGMPGTVVLFGGGALDNSDHDGGRFRVGYRLGDCGNCALETSYFFLDPSRRRFSASSDQFPVLGRPFFSLNQNTESAQLTAFPGVSSGTIMVDSKSQLWGFDANLRCDVCCGCWYTVGVLVGGRYLNLKESLEVTENIQALPTAPLFPNAQIRVFDRFTTRNEFAGPQVGATARLNWGRWSLDARGTVALGDTRQSITIDGNQMVSLNGVVTNFRGGLLALPTNIGTFHRDRFSVVPELNLNVGYQLNDRWRLFVGYSFLYWSNVVRPGDQIDRVIDITRIPNFPVPGVLPTGLARPAVPFRESNFWAQGINFGVEFRY